MSNITKQISILAGGAETRDIGAEAQNIDVSYDNNGHVIEDINTTTPNSSKSLATVLKGNLGSYYGVSTTGASTARKVVTVAEAQNFELKAGIIIGISFVNTNVAGNPTINVNNTGAKPIFKDNAVQTSGDAGIVGGYTSYFQYDGTNWCWISSGASNKVNSGHIIQNTLGTAMNSRDNLQFVGSNVTDNSTNNKTVVTTTLESLNDTNISSPTNKQILVYNSSTGKWENKAPATEKIVLTEMPHYEVLMDLCEGINI